MASEFLSFILTNGSILGNGSSSFGDAIPSDTNGDGGTITSPNDVDDGASVVGTFTSLNRTSSTVVVSSMRLYFSLLLVGFLTFELLQKYWPNLYTAPTAQRSSQEKRGVFRWIYNVLFVKEERYLEQSGFDAYFFLRFIRMGKKLAAAGILQSLILFPVYYYQETYVAEEQQLDFLQKLTIANVKNGQDLRLWVSAGSAYCTSFYAMYLIYVEYIAFCRHRHRFFSQLEPQQYTILVTDLPPNLSQPDALKMYLNYLFNDRVYEVNMGLECSKLEQLVNKRAKARNHLEHALAQYDLQKRENAHGKRSKSCYDLVWRCHCCGHGFKRGKEAVEYYEKELNELNQQVIREKKRLIRDKQEFLQRTQRDYGSIGEKFWSVLRKASRSKQQTPDDSTGTRGWVFRALSGLRKKKQQQQQQHDEHVPLLQQKQQQGSKQRKNQQKEEEALVQPEYNPTFRNCAFVSFTSLKATHTSTQILQTDDPTLIHVELAPHPLDIVWENYGVSGDQQRSWGWISNLATFWIVFFWTLPTAFVTSLASVDKIRGSFENAGAFLDKHPFVEYLCEQISPLALIAMHSLARVIFKWISAREGHISHTGIQRSLFKKLCYFQVIQMFFITAIAGSIASTLLDMVNQPKNILLFLGRNIPSQGTFFIIFLIAQTGLTLTMDLCRIVPLTLAGLHRLFAPQLTRRERNSDWYGLLPLSMIKDFDTADLFDRQYLAVLLVIVFVPIAPLVSYFAGFFFLISEIVYKRYFLYVRPDTYRHSSGNYWPELYMFLIGALFVSQLTIIGLCVLKQGIHVIPIVLILPFCTFLFHRMVGAVYLREVENLPLDRCCDVDIERTKHSFQFLQDVYQQPAIQDANSIQVDHANYCELDENGLVSLPL